MFASDSPAPCSTSSSSTTLPTTTNSNGKRLPEVSVVTDNAGRKKLKDKPEVSSSGELPNTPMSSRTRIIDETDLPLQMLVDNGLISADERKNCWTELLPATNSSSFSQEDRDNWATRTLVRLINNIAPLANACLESQWQSQLLSKRTYTPAAFKAVSEQLIEIHRRAVKGALSAEIPLNGRRVTEWPASLRLLLGDSKGPLDQKLFQHLHTFFSCRPQLLEDPGIATATKKLIESQWERIAKEVRPYPKLWKELQAGENLLKKIDAESYGEPEVVHFRDADTIPLEKAAITLLSEASEPFRTLLTGSFSDGRECIIRLEETTSEEFQILLDCLSKGDNPITFENIAALLKLSDLYLVDSISTKCCQWVRTCNESKNDSEKLQATLQSICRIQQEVSQQLPHIGKEWEEARDEAVSSILSKAPRATTLEAWVAMIVNSQNGASSWPTSLSISCPFDFNNLAPLEAVEKLTLSTKYRIANLSKFERLLRLNTLILKGTGEGIDGDWKSLLCLPNLHTLRVKAMCTGFNDLCANLAKMKTAHVTLPKHRILRRENDVLQLSKNNHIRTLEILEPCSYAFCAEILYQMPLLETLSVTASNQFKLRFDRVDQSVTVKGSPCNYAQFQVNFPNIPKSLSGPLFENFGFAQKLYFLSIFEEGSTRHEMMTVERPSKEPPPL